MVICFRTPGLDLSSWRLPFPCVRVTSPSEPHLRSFLGECPCHRPSSVEVGLARWSQCISSLSLSTATTNELRERSPHRASLFRGRVQLHAVSASMGAYLRPTLELCPTSACLRSSITLDLRRNSAAATHTSGLGDQESERSQDFARGPASLELGGSSTDFLSSTVQDPSTLEFGDSGFRPAVASFTAPPACEVYATLSREPLISERLTCTSL